MLRPIIFGLTCLAMAGVAQAAGNQFDGAYVGTRTPTKGFTPQCPPREDVSATIAGNSLQFSNSRLQHFGLTFYPHPDGSFDTTYVDVGGATVEIQGHVSQGALDAHVVDYATSCEYQWHLEKKSPKNSN
jgi:hypothetical protein